MERGLTIMSYNIRTVEDNGKTMYVVRDALDAVGCSKETRIPRSVVRSKLQYFPKSYLADRETLIHILDQSRKPDAKVLKQMLMKSEDKQDSSIRRAEILKELLSEQVGAEQKAMIISEIFRLITGKELEAAAEKLYSATELGELVGASASKIGLVAKRYGLKTPEYGREELIESKYSGKQYLRFVYYEKALVWFRHHRELL